MADLDHFDSLLQVFFIGMGAAVEHDAGEPEGQGFHALIEGQAVVIVEHHRHAGSLGRMEHPGGDQLQFPIRQQHFRRPDDYRIPQFFRRSDHCFQCIGVGGIEQPHPVVVLPCGNQHVIQIG